MRLWCGKDVEYNPGYGIMTLFVESNNPDIDKIVNILSDNDYNIGIIYFGAGEVDIKNWEFLSDLHKLSDIYIVALESSASVPDEVINMFDFVIFRMCIPKISNNVYIKCRTDTEVGITNSLNFRVNSLMGLSDGQYSGDIEIYKEEI